MKALLRLTLASAIAGLLVFALTAPASASWSRDEWYSGPKTTATSDRVNLTFDDCPEKSLHGLRNFKRVIRKAVRMNVAITIAPLGDCVDYFREQFDVNIASYARQHGQYVISHSKNHPDLTTLTNKQIRYQLHCCNSSVASRYVRAPYGSYNDRVLKVMQKMTIPRRMWLWSVDTRDWTGKTRNEVVHYTLNNTGDGDTVLMHMEWNGFSPKALKRMVRGLRHQGHPVCRTFRGWDERHHDNPVETTRNWFWRIPC